MFNNGLFSCLATHKIVQSDGGGTIVVHSSVFFNLSLKGSKMGEEYFHFIFFNLKVAV